MWTALVLLAAALATDAEETFSLTVGGPALIFALPAVNEPAAIEMVRKSVVTLNDITGVKPSYPSSGVVLYFFQKANGGEALKDIDSLTRRFRNQKVRILGICIDEIPPEEMRPWVDTLKLDFPILADNFRIVSERYGVRATPMVVIVDGAGAIFAVGNPTPTEVVASLEAQVDAMLKK